jgi:uncharacterized protein (TIGR04222 family)
MTDRRLDLYELALLSGGTDRVVETALVVLVESGRVRVQAPGRLAAIDPAGRDPVEGAVLEALGIGGRRSIDVICWRLDGDERITGIARGLATGS